MQRIRIVAFSILGLYVASAIITAALLVGPTLDQYRASPPLKYDTTGLSRACALNSQRCTEEERIIFIRQNADMIEHARTLYGVYWADSEKYMPYATGGLSLSGLVTLSYNALGPALLVFLSGGNNVIIGSINCIVLALTIVAAVQYLPINPLTYVVCILANPMLYFSLTSVNKEIMAFSSLIFAAIFLERGGRQYWILSLGLAALARWPQFLLLAMFFALCWVNRKLSKPRQFMYVWFAVALILGSITFPIFRHMAVLKGSFLMERTWAAGQMLKVHGVLGALNSLQDDHWYGLLIAIGPKTLMQLTGNIFRLGATLSGQAKDVNYKDVYNTYVVLGHQVWMTAALGVLLVLRRCNWTSYTMQLILWYAAFNASIPYINYRLMFPLVGLIAIQLARTKSKPEESSQSG